MTTEEAKTCKQHLELLKAEIEWNKPIGYQIDLDMAIETLEKQKEIEELLEEKMQELYRDSDVYFEFSQNKKQVYAEASLDEGISIGLLRGALMIQEVLSKMRGEI